MWEIIRSKPLLRNNLSCHSTCPRRQAPSRHEKLQLIFNKYRYEYHFRREMTSRQLRDVPRLAYSKQPEASRQRLIVACDSRKNRARTHSIRSKSFVSNRKNGGLFLRYAPTPSRNNLSASALLSTSFLPHSSISRHLHTILAFLQCRFLIYERPEWEILRSVTLHRRYDTNIICYRLVKCSKNVNTKRMHEVDERKSRRRTFF